MFNHQLDYNQWLSTLLTDAETSLSNMRDEVWAMIHALVENKGVTFDACLHLVLRVAYYHRSL